MPRITRLRIPNDDLPKLHFIVDLAQESFSLILEAFRDTPPQLDPERFVERIAQETNVPTDDIEILFSVLGSLYLTRARLGLAVDEFVDVIHRSIEWADNEAWADDVDWDGFKHRLTDLLQLDQTLGVVTKAGHLRMQYERVLHEMRVYTELRPIFESNANRLPAAGIINHSIKIAFHQNNGIEEIFVAADDEGLLDIKANIERALEKSGSLHMLLDNASIPVLKVRENDD